MNILLVSHGALCEGVLDAYKMLFAQAGNVHTCKLTLDGVEDFRARLTAQVDELLAQGDVLIMADLKGGTPYNESNALFIQNPEHIRLAAGLSLPMLLETGVAALDSDDLDALYATALEAGTFGIQGTDLPADSADNDEDDLF